MKSHQKEIEHTDSDSVTMLKVANLYEDGTLGISMIAYHHDKQVIAVNCTEDYPTIPYADFQEFLKRIESIQTYHVSSNGN